MSEKSYDAKDFENLNRDLKFLKRYFNATNNIVKKEIIAVNSII